MEPIKYHYQFLFPDNTEKSFELVLDPDTLSLISSSPLPYPDWTRLENQQCSNCPLNKAEHPHCPNAVGMTEPIEYFRDSLSYTDVKLVVTSGHRRIEVETSLQKALGSLLGIYMVTSGCPHLEKLRPMVRYHLPVSTLDETQYRVFGMYLMAQYFIRLNGGNPDWDMKNLVGIYDEIKVVNRAFMKRISSVLEKDASLNAVVILNNFADWVNFSLDGEMADELETLFLAYLPEKV